MNAVDSPYKNIVVDGATHQTSPFWRNTIVAGGTDLTLDGAVGFEADEIENSNDGRIFTKHGSSIVADVPYYDDDGLSAGTGSFEAGIAVSQTAPAHGIIVSMSAMNIMWLLSDYHSRGSAIKDDDFVQGFVNVLNDLGAVPATPDVGLTIDAPQPMTAYGIDWEANQPPTAVVNGPYSGIIDSPIQFSSSGSSDPEGSPLTYDWNFGDGSANSSEANPTHTYTTTVGSPFTVTLTVTDTAAATDQAATTATITAAGGAETNQPINSAAAPTEDQTDGGVPYELGMAFTPLKPLQLTALWVYTSTSEPATNASAKLWTGEIGNILTENIAMTSPPAGSWKRYDLPAPRLLMTEREVTVSHDINTYYSIGAAYSDPTNLSNVRGKLGANPDVFPGQDTANNFGMDISYILREAALMNATIPSERENADLTGYEMGVRFTPTASGQITGVFLWITENSSTADKTVRIWQGDGTPITTEIITIQGTDQWSYVELTSPVSCTAGQTYVITANMDRYGTDGTYGPVTGVGTPEGAFNATPGSFPSNFSATNYCVDFEYKV